jgi:hypothetical protein
MILEFYECTCFHLRNSCHSKYIADSRVYYLPLSIYVVFLKVLFGFMKTCISKNWYFKSLSQFEAARIYSRLSINISLEIRIFSAFLSEIEIMKISRDLHDDWHNFTFASHGFVIAPHCLLLRFSTINIYTFSHLVFLNHLHPRVKLIFMSLFFFPFSDGTCS